jgi:hypothetical protein
VRLQVVQHGGVAGSGGADGEWDEVEVERAAAGGAAGQLAAARGEWGDEGQGSMPTPCGRPQEQREW